MSQPAGLGFFGLAAGPLGDVQATYDTPPRGAMSGVVLLGVAGALGYGTYKLWGKHKVWGTLLGLTALGWASGAAMSFSREG